VSTPTREPEQPPAEPLVRSRHAEIKPIRGNARRRTLALLAATGAAVLAAHFLLPAGPSAKPPAGRSTAPAGAANAPAPSAPTFYVSADGDDSADGTTPATAWRTLARADRRLYRPGERLLLRGGDTFTGGMDLRPGEAGQAGKPVEIASYGSGRAEIDAPSSAAITVYDTAGVAISGLVLVGPGAATSQAAGVDVYNDMSGDRRFSGITVSGVDVSGFRNGISIGGGNGGSGFSDIRISDSQVHANRDNGLVTYGPVTPPPGYPFRNVTVTNVAAFDNVGNPDDHKTSTGSGIDLGGVDGGLVEASTAYGNGSACDSLNGPVGIWAHDSTGVVIRHSVSYANRTGGYTDGGGFDLDQRTDNSVLEYNLAYDNYGPGYMVYAGTSAARSTGNTVRFNVSLDDARLPLDADSITYGALMLAGYETNASVHHNSVVQTVKGERSALLNLGAHLTGASVRDNIFSAQSGELVRTGAAPTPAQAALQGNLYYSAAGSWRVSWGAGAYSALTAWRSGTGQEKLAGQATGSAQNPGLVPAAAAAWDPTRKAVLAPGAGSAAAASGLDLAAKFGTDVGTEDYLGGALSAPTAAGALMPAAP